MEPQTPPPQPPVPPTPPPPQSSPVKNSLLVIMSVLLLVAVSLAGFFFWQMQRLSKQLAQYQIQSTPLASPEPSPEAQKAEECIKQTTCEGPTPCMANPAAVFCTCMGGELETRENEQGQYGVCKIEGKEYDEWEYFRKYSSSQ